MGEAGALLLANSTSFVKTEAAPAFVLAQVCAGDGAGLAAYARKGSLGAWVWCRRRCSFCLVARGTVLEAPSDGKLARVDVVPN